MNLNPKYFWKYFNKKNNRIINFLIECTIVIKNLKEDLSITKSFKNYFSIFLRSILFL